MPLPDSSADPPLRPDTTADIFAQYSVQTNRGLLIVGPQRRVLAINDSARRMLDFDGTVPDVATRVVPDLEFDFVVGSAFHDRREQWHESYLPDPDRLLRFHLMPVLSREGIPAYVVAEVDDVTRLRHLETVRRDFVANISHELRTPLASISLLIETLQNGAMDDPEAAQTFLQRIQVETRAMTRLVGELLELSRLESGALSLDFEPTDIAAALGDVAARLSTLAGHRHVELRIDVQPDLLPARADPKRLEQILMNLTHNAIKFTPPGGSATLRAQRSGPGIQIEVADTGVGMNVADIDRVFERFYKIDKVRSRDAGSGLGLAVTRHLVELHGGRLQAVSEPGRGSRFYFALPLST
ncbi:MAG TPA: ATP-binding protein [Chloroflexota bacterium]|nr:ATP-binding protein [Chloroflexota bacterium]